MAVNESATKQTITFPDYEAAFREATGKEVSELTFQALAARLGDKHKLIPKGA